MDAHPNRWLTGTWLVARRALVENLASKSFKVISALLLLLGLAAVIVPQLFDDDGTTYELATVGPAPQELRAAIDAVSESSDFEVEYVERDSEDDVRATVRDGDATAGLVEDTLYTSSNADGVFPRVVSQVVVGLETVAKMSEAGLSPDQIGQLQSIQPPEQVVVSDVEDEGRSGIGFAVGVVLYLAITFAGSAIGTAVGMEKSSRISEVLLAVLRPSQLLVGNVVAVGLVTLVQLLLLTIPVAVGIRLYDIGLPPAASSDIVLSVVWFVLGFALYAFVFAAAGVLVDKATEISSAVSLVVTVLVAAYLAAILIVPADPDGTGSVLVSLFPFTAPMAMPIRWASGDVPVVQLLLAMLLTAATAAALVGLASAVYRRALVITGRRVKLAELFARDR